MMREFEIERQFNVKIESIKPNKGVYLLKTNKGNKCLKKINYGVQKLLFVYAAKNHLINSGFKNVDSYNLNANGEPYALVNEDIYTLSEWIDGRECDFTNKDDLIKAAKALAKMHIASKGYEPPENSKLKSDLERWPHLMEKRVRSLEKMRDMARKKANKTRFDIKYIEHYKEYTELGKIALKTLNDSEYMNICKKTEEMKSFCHHDYTYHNIIIDDKENVNIIDFDYCKREVRVYDVANFMIKVLKRVNWDKEYSKLILDSYNEINPIKDEEYKVLFAFLLFPQRFWRLCNRFFYNEVNWAQRTFDNKITDLIDEKERYLNFIEEFKNMYSKVK